MDLKKVINRSFERTIQIEQYQPAKFYASYSEEISADTDDAACTRISAILYGNAKADVEQAIIDYKNEKIKAETVKRIDNGGWPKEE